jgi:hypothetical protein
MILLNVGVLLVGHVEQGAGNLRHDPTSLPRAPLTSRPVGDTVSREGAEPPGVHDGPDFGSSTCRLPFPHRRTAHP